MINYFQVPSKLNLINITNLVVSETEKVEQVIILSVVGAKLGRHLAIGTLLEVGHVAMKMHTEVVDGLDGRQEVGGTALEDGRPPEEGLLAVEHHGRDFCPGGGKREENKSHVSQCKNSSSSGNKLK